MELIFALHLNRVVPEVKVILTEFIDEENHVQHWLGQSFKQGLNNWEKHHKCGKSFPIFSLEWTFNMSMNISSQNADKKNYLESWIYAWRFISKTNEEGVEDSEDWEYYPAKDNNKEA